MEFQDNFFSGLSHEEIKHILRIKKVKGKNYLYLKVKFSLGQGEKQERHYLETYVGPEDMGLKDLYPKFTCACEKLHLKLFDMLCDFDLHNYSPDCISAGDVRELADLRAKYILLRELRGSEMEFYEESMYTKYVYGTTSIEGNTYSLRETDLTLNEGLTIGGKSKREFYEIENYARLKKHLKALGKIKITEGFIRRVHSIIMENIDFDSAGKYRRIPVGISGVEFEPVPPVFIRDELRALLSWHEQNLGQMHPIELAAGFHQRFEEIHPFKDGNGRVGREILRLMLMENDCPTIYISPRNRELYLKALDAGNAGDKLALCEFIKQSMMDANKRFLE